MKRNAGSLVLVVVSFCFFLAAARASAQGDRIVIPAGTPEDHDLQAISNEQDTAKKLAMYQAVSYTHLDVYKRQAQHGDHVGGKDEAQRTSAEDGAHQFTLAELARKFHHRDTPVTQKPRAELYWLVCNF